MMRKYIQEHQARIAQTALFKKDKFHLGPYKAEKATTES